MLHLLFSPGVSTLALSAFQQQHFKLLGFFFSEFLFIFLLSYTSYSWDFHFNFAKLCLLRTYRFHGKLFFPPQTTFSLPYNRKTNKKEIRGEFRDACDPPGHHLDGCAAAGCSVWRRRLLENKTILLILAPVLSLVHSCEATDVPGAVIKLPAEGDQPCHCAMCHIQPFWKLLSRAFAILLIYIYIYIYETHFLSNSLHSADANGYFYFSITSLSMAQRH